MILEHALLRIRDGESGAFEAALRDAIPLIAASAGFEDIEVRPAAEELGLYLLLVRWKDVESHRDGFRLSDRYRRWRALLHHFYEPIPDVTYFGPSIIDSPVPAG
ncbi:antibiotic biosynthesis monooxygenase [Sphingomonas sp.]|uniref:antibiotic biosynthesis monooxygenase family protein n=1 Tax=Sphingomonas sp. TaxID=28214 RepID=UPI000DB8B1A7|nr:antibiotic biosynthesis monooxygenase family protein [Sphingomonas sp.]PZU11906.1 MAG: antibiotic biosynthesis monooxygenase [Sphingomonas sp.]